MEAVTAYNSTVSSFPTNMTAGMFDFDEKPKFQIENRATITATPAGD
jgi:LemA protein